jgi:hypothetical protein
MECFPTPNIMQKKDGITGEDEDMKEHQDQIHQAL